MMGNIKSGIAFMVFGILAFAASFVIFKDIDDQLHAVIYSMSAADPEVAILQRVVLQCGIVNAILSGLASFIVVTGIFHIQSGRKAYKE